MEAKNLVEQFVELFQRRTFGDGRFWLEGNFPVSLNLHAAMAHKDGMARRQFTTVLQHGILLYSVSVTKEVRESRVVNFLFQLRDCDQRFDFRCECKIVVVEIIVKRFDTEPVAGGEQRLAAFIPYCKREH